MSDKKNEVQVVAGDDIQVRTGLCVQRLPSLLKVYAPKSDEEPNELVLESYARMTLLPRGLRDQVLDYLSALSG